MSAALFAARAPSALSWHSLFPATPFSANFDVIREDVVSALSLKRETAKTNRRETILNTTLAAVCAHIHRGCRVASVRTSFALRHVLPLFVKRDSVSREDTVILCVRTGTVCKVRGKLQHTHAHQVRTPTFTVAVAPVYLVSKMILRIAPHKDMLSPPSFRPDSLVKISPDPQHFWKWACRVMRVVVGCFLAPRKRVTPTLGGN